MSDSTRGPAWLQEVTTLVAAYPHFALSGNIHDSYFGPAATGSDPEPRLGDVPTLLTESLVASGFEMVLLEMGYKLEPGAGVAAAQRVLAGA